MASPEELIETIFKSSERIDQICTGIYKKVETTKMDVIKDFNPYIEPKKTLDYLLVFYKTFQEAYEIISENKQNFTEVGLVLLQSIFKNNVLGTFKAIQAQEDTLRDYAGIKIVDSLLEETRALTEEVISQILPIYFSNLLDDKEVDLMADLSSFLMSVSDKKLFLSRYSTTILNKISYEDIGLDRKKLLDRTKDIEGHFSRVNKYNVSILGGSNAQSINQGLNKLLLINLKKVIADNLLVVEKEESLASVPFCIELNSHLESHEAEIKEIEELYVFKDELNKIVCNIFLAFIENVKTLSQPNKYCDIETTTLSLKRALDSLEDNKMVSRVFLKNYGPFFKVSTLEDITSSFSTIVLRKVVELSGQLEGIKKAIYLINNLYTLQGFVEEVDGLNLRTAIEDNSDLLVNVCKDELDSKTGRRFSTFVDSNLKSFKSYYLPDAVRNKVVPKVKAIIWENILTKGYQGNENALNDSINDIFTGQ